MEKEHGTSSLERAPGKLNTASDIQVLKLLQVFEDYSENSLERPTLLDISGILKTPRESAKWFTTFCTNLRRLVKFDETALNITDNGEQMKFWNDFDIILWITKNAENATLIAFLNSKTIIRNVHFPQEGVQFYYDPSTPLGVEVSVHGVPHRGNASLAADFAAHFVPQRGSASQGLAETPTNVRPDRCCASSCSLRRENDFIGSFIAKREHD